MDYSNFVVSFILLFIGAIIGNIFAYFQSIAILKKQIFLNNAAEFRNVVLDTRYRFEYGVFDDSNNSLNIKEIAESDFLILQKAYFKFRYALPKKERAAFDNAWEYYICKPDESEVYDELFFDYLAYLNDNGTEYARTEEECQQTALERIDGLLELTK